jgi:hypothetical protein
MSRSFAALATIAVAAVVAVGASSGCARRQAPEPVVAPVPEQSPPSVIPVEGITPASADSSKVHEYRGAYSSGFEISWFEPCGAPAGDAMWWVTLTEDARMQRDSLLRGMPRKPTEGLAVTWRATVSPRMRGGAGQMGRGSRYMLVTRIVSLHPLSGNGACGTGTTGG